MRPESWISLWSSKKYGHIVQGNGYLGIWHILHGCQVLRFLPPSFLLVRMVAGGCGWGWVRGDVLRHGDQHHPAVASLLLRLDRYQGCRLRGNSSRISLGEKIQFNSKEAKTKSHQRERGLVGKWTVVTSREGGWAKRDRPRWWWTRWRRRCQRCREHPRGGRPSLATAQTSPQRGCSEGLWSPETIKYVLNGSLWQYIEHLCHIPAGFWGLRREAEQQMLAAAAAEKLLLLHQGSTLPSLGWDEMRLNVFPFVYRVYEPNDHTLYW